MAKTPGIMERRLLRLVDDFDPVKAVVLFGSRARGTARFRSDWDVAVLLDRDPALVNWDGEPDLEILNVIYNDLKTLSARAQLIGSLEAAIVRDGRILAGEWERPELGGERVVDLELIKESLTSASRGLVHAINYACTSLGETRTVPELLRRHTQYAAERTTNAAMMHLGIDPVQVHDLIALADQLEREGPGDRRTAQWAATVRSMNRPPEGRHGWENEPAPFELLKRPSEMVRTITAFFAVVLRDVTETRAGFAPHAAAVAGAAEKQSRKMHEHRKWTMLPHDMRVRLDAWVAEVQGIGHLAGSRTPQTVCALGNPADRQGVRP